MFGSGRLIFFSFVMAGWFWFVWFCCNCLGSTVLIKYLRLAFAYNIERKTNIFSLVVYPTCHGDRIYLNIATI